MSDDASTYPPTDRPSGRLGTLSTTPWLLFPTAVLAFAVWQLVAGKQPWMFWASLIEIAFGVILFGAVASWWWTTVVWFAWEDGVLRYRLPCRARVRSLLRAEVLSVRPIRRPATCRGFEIQLADGVLRFEYDRAGNALRLRDLLIRRGPAAASLIHPHDRPEPYA